MTVTSGRSDFSAIAIPLIRPPPPTGTITRARSGTCASNSTPMPPCPAITSGSSNGWTKARPPSCARSRAVANASSTVPGVNRTVAPSASAASTFAIEAPLGHEHLARDSACLGRVGDCLRVVARAPGDDATSTRVTERGDLGERSAQLERAGPLQVLGLEHDGRPTTTGQRLRGEDRRLPDDARPGGHRASDVRRRRPIVRDGP